MAKKINPSALHESGSEKSAVSVNSDAADKFRARRKNTLSEEDLLTKLLEGNKAALGRAITLIESNQPKHKKKAEILIEGALPHAQKSIRIGITGVPGVGKSTFIESFGSYLVNQGKRVAVLAVDPSSTVSRGSILGDKTRMENLVKEKNAFVRPSPAGDSLGGVARKSRESILLCEAAGFDVILIETVGVGQSETTVHSMTDFFLLLKLAGAGDELQGIKRGIIEMADAIVINKADGDNLKAAREAKMEFKRALNLYPTKDNGWSPKVKLCSALQNTGISEVWDLILGYEKMVKGNGYFGQHRREQNKFWMFQTIDEHLKNRFYRDPEIKEALKIQLKAIENNKTTAFVAANELIRKFEAS